MSSRNDARTTDEFAGTTRFELQGKLGEGAMGIVYRAHDHERNVPVALKLLRRVDSATVYRFKREFRALADVTHRNLVNLYELVSLDSDWFFTMELVEGSDVLSFMRAAWGGESPGRGSDTSTYGTGVLARSLATATLAGAEQTRTTLATIGSSGAANPGPEAPVPTTALGGQVGRVPTEPEHFAHIERTFLQLVDGVQALHRAGHLHRDIKPSNIMVDGDGRVVLLDFGVVAPLSTAADGTNGIAGTPAYMAPEQVLGGPLSEACDWYAVGVVLFETLTGRRPFSGAARSIMDAKTTLDAASVTHLAPAAPATLVALCEDLLSRTPGARPGGDGIRARLAGAPASRPAPASEHDSAQISRDAYLETLVRTFATVRAGTAQTALIVGASGVGKTAIMLQAVEAFRAASPDLVVLQGRCYERESVPYKALDNLIDELSTFLLGLPRAEAVALLPTHFQSLAQLFPVLRRVAALAPEAEDHAASGNHHEQRRRSFSALRTLLVSLAARAPLVLCIDDVHWGDVDSAALVSEIMSEPGAPPLLLIATCRAEDEAGSAFLRALAPAMPQVQRVRVDPLSSAEALELATRMLAAARAPVPNVAATAQVIARESRGSPLFLRELALFVELSGRDDSGLNTVTLEDVLRARIDRLPASSRVLLRLVAVASGPVPQGVVQEAAHLGVDARPALAALRSAKLVRSAGVRDEDTVAPFHNQIRDVVVGQLGADALLTCHAALARGLEASGVADPESLALHYEGAGDTVRAGRFAAAAGDRAYAALAFEHAAAHYSRSLSLSALQPAQASALWRKLGDALDGAGRGGDAAEAYQRAMEGATPTDAFDDERRAAECLLKNGNIEEGRALLSSVVRKVGLRIPKGSGFTLAAIALRRAWLRMRGTGFTERALDQIAPRDLSRIDVCWSAAIGFGYCDVLQTAYFGTRYQLLAYAAGERTRAHRGLVYEIIYGGGMGHATRKRTLRIQDELLRQVQGSNDPYLNGMSHVAVAYRAYPLAEFTAARTSAERGVELLSKHAAGVSWELSVARMLQMWCLYYEGATAELQRRIPRALRHATERGDWFMVTNLTTTVLSSHWLIDDNVAEARRTCDAVMERWPTSYGFLLQHYWELVARTQADLYAGDGAGAWQRVQQAWKPLSRSFVLVLAMARMEALHLRGRAALAAAVSDPERIADARRATAKLARRKSNMTPGLVHGLRAGIAWREQRPDEALAQLSSAAAAFDSAGMAMHATCARFRHGQLIGGDEGRAALAAATRQLTEQRVRNPARLVALHFPGFDDARD